MVNVYDFVRAAALVFGLGFSAQQERKSWIWCDSVLWGVYALGLFIFPGSMFPGNESVMLSYTTRFFAGMIIGMETMCYLTRRTRDENVIGATLWSRLISSLLLLTFLTYSYFQHANKFSDKTLYFDMLAYALLLLTTVYQFWRGEYRVGGREQKGCVNTILRMMFVVSFMTGLIFMTYPSWVLLFKKLDSMEALTVRCAGAIMFGTAFVPLYAPSFRDDEDRSAFFLSSVVCQMFAFINLNLAYFVDGLFDSRETLIMHTGFLGSFPMVLGLYLLWRKDSGNQAYHRHRSKSQ